MLRLKQMTLLGLAATMVAIAVQVKADTAQTAGTAQPPAQEATPAAQAPAQSPATAAPPCVPMDVNTALPLLDRVQRVLDKAISGDIGKVALERGDVDEMRAEIAQIRAALTPATK
jgi:hypothetical protein